MIEGVYDRADEIENSAVAKYQQLLLMLFTNEIDSG